MPHSPCPGCEITSSEKSSGSVVACCPGLAFPSVIFLCLGIALDIVGDILTSQQMVRHCFDLPGDMRDTVTCFLHQNCRSSGSLQYPLETRPYISHTPHSVYRDAKALVNYRALDVISVFNPRPAWIRIFCTTR